MHLHFASLLFKRIVPVSVVIVFRFFVAVKINTYIQDMSILRRLARFEMCFHENKREWVNCLL